MSNYHQPDLPTSEQLRLIHQKADHNLKYKLIVNLMQEADLRVTEVVRLQVCDFDFERRLLAVRSLKKRASAKSHLLHNYQQGHIIRMDEFQYPKQLLAGLLLELFDGEKEQILKMISRTETRQEFETRIATRESIKRLCELAVEVTREKEYAILIDDVTNITRSGVRILEVLKNHFHIIAAARRIRMEHRSAFTNFELIELDPLPRPEAVSLIDRLSAPLLPRIEDYESYKNRIWEDTQGNPLFILEMVDPLAKEPRISIEATERVKHTASKTEVDFTAILIICISSLMGLR